MNILAIDQSMKSTGWAVQSDGLLESGRESFQKQSEKCQPCHLAAFWKWLNKTLDLQNPSLVVFEEPFVVRSGAGQMPLFALRAFIVTACELRGIEAIGVPPSTLKKWAAGHGHAEKPQMQAAARERYPLYRPEEDPGADEADAILLRAYGQERPDLEMQVEKPKKKRRVKKTP